jgi:hypothetical protein
MSFARKTLVLLAAVLITLPVIAAEGPVGHMTVSSSAVQWQPRVAAEKVTLTITLPNGEVIARDFAPGEAIVLRTQDLGTKVAEGSYVYELRALPRVSDEVRTRLREARMRDDDAAIAKIQKEAGIGEPVVQSGGFAIHNGGFVTEAAEPDTPRTPGLKKEANSVPLKPASQFTTVNDDESIVGSLCVGLDCTSSESFGFDTIRLKENNTRIKFQDTSTASGFPNVNWQLTANDSNSGGLNKFSIDDVTNSKTPFTVIAAAPTNSLFVASSGKVGFGNSSPGLNLHITATDTPAIRQEQTSGGGFTAQTWDIGANEANWFVRDLTGGSRLPLRIRPGAPTSSIDISASGKVGVGTASPAANVHVFGASNADTFVGIGEDPAGSTTTESALTVGYGGNSLGIATGFFNVRPDSNAVAPNPSLRFLTGNVQRMIIDNNGNIGLGVSAPSNPIQHSSGAVLTSGGVWQNASSRALKENIADLSEADAMAALHDLNPVTFAYKVDPKEKHVGFIAEDVPDLVAAKDRKSLSAMDIVGVLTKVVQEQEKTIEALKARVDQLEKQQQQQ